MTRHIILILLSALPVLSQLPSGEAILKSIDQNMSARSRTAVSRMVIHGRRNSRTIEAKTWTEGTDKSFTEYLSPAREKGTKMLKLEDQLWMYTPSTDRIIQISGHMLRQSVMGSDLSYEDMMEDPHMTDNYDAVVTGSDQVDDRDCWVMDLSANRADVAYHFRKLWVDKERMIPLREDLIAKSGKLLKTLNLMDVKQIDGRWYPMRMRFKDVLKEGQGTEVMVESVEFDVIIPAYMFTKAALRR